MTITDIWQEYDCPNSGIDFDRAGDEILADGESFYCCGCGQYHVAGKDGPKSTMVEHDDREPGDFEYRELPKDSEEKAEWLTAISPRSNKH